MKISNVAIQSYQTITRPEAQSRPVEQLAELNKPDNEQKITLVPQSGSDGSRLAVRANGNGYADMLSQTERTALDLLFAKYQERVKSGGATYGKEQGNVEPDHGLGLLVDLKG